MFTKFFFEKLNEISKHFWRKLKKKILFLIISKKICKKILKKLLVNKSEVKKILF